MLYCGEFECCANRSQHKMLSHDICLKVGCDRQFRNCCPKDLNNHLKDHPECPACHERFLTEYSSYYGRSLQRHKQEYPQCQYCKEMKCNGENHSIAGWGRCEDVNCNYRFTFCTKEQHRAHLDTHPLCDCGCGKYYLNEAHRKQHKSVFPCKDCSYVFPTSEAWFQHSKTEDHVLLCSCKSCSSKPNCYFAKARNMRHHFEKNGVRCSHCQELFYTDEALGYHKTKCNKIPKPVPVAPKTEVKNVIPVADSTKSSGAVNWGEVDDKLVKMVNENLSIVDFPAWTLTNQEKEDLKILRNEIQSKLSSAKSFQLRVQGSIVKNTAIPAMADFDFILEIRASETPSTQVKEEIGLLINDLHCVFCYGEGQIQTWLALEKEVLFDLVLKYPKDARFNDFEKNVDLVKTQPTNIHSFIRGLKYWCKRSNAPIKSFIVELIGIELFSNNSKVEFISFLNFLQDSNWIHKVDLVEAPSLEDLKKLHDLAMKALTVLTPSK